MKKLKHISILLFFAAPWFLAPIVLSCSKDDDKPQDQIVGTWELQYYYVDMDNNLIDLSKAETYQKFENKGCVYVTINKNKDCGLIEKSCNAEYENNHYSCSYSIDNNTIYKNKKCDNMLNNLNSLHLCEISMCGEKINYNIKGDKLILAFNGWNGEIVTGGYTGECIYYGYYVRK